MYLSLSIGVTIRSSPVVCVMGVFVKILENKRSKCVRECDIPNCHTRKVKQINVLNYLKTTVYIKKTNS